MNKIRKISVGKGFPNDVIHYVVGQEHHIIKDDEVLAGQSLYYTITSITRDIEYTQLTGSSTYNIYVNDGEETFLWKTIENMPVKVEYDLKLS